MSTSSVVFQIAYEGSFDLVSTERFPTTIKATMNAEAIYPPPLIITNDGGADTKLFLHVENAYLIPYACVSHFQR
jgi:hypothetical protein